jgi:threonine dehydrogenase-like Zn-dependent dehydrogenase
LKERLKRFSRVLPPVLQKECRLIYHKLNLRWDALRLRRKVLSGYKIIFPCAEVADYERFETLSAGPGEAVVRLECTVVSPGTERAYLLGLPGAARPFPVSPGYSGAGVVESVGKGVTALAVGDRVAGRLRHSSLATVHCDYLFRLPDGVSGRSGAFIELGIIVLQGIRKAGIIPGESVLVVGQGIIGQLANRLARAFGATPVIGTARSIDKAALSTGSDSADRFVPMPELAVGHLMGTFDVVVEATGDASCLSTACSCARPGGRVIMLGSSRGLSSLDFSGEVVLRGLTLVGAHITGMPSTESTLRYWTYRDEGYLFLRWLAEGRIKVDDLVSAEVNPAEADDFYRRLALWDSKIITGCFDWTNFAPAASLSDELLGNMCRPTPLTRFYLLSRDLRERI